MMYSIGHKVVHPCYGAGTIVRIQEKTIGNTNHSYYVIHTVSRPMQLMVAVSRAEEANLRAVGDPSGLRQALSICCEMPAEEDIVRDLRVRQSGMRDRLKSGRFDDVADVARTLFFMSTRRPLGTVDRQLFDQGKELLAGELALAAGVEVIEAMHEVERSLNQMLGAAEAAS
jgi:RNA polymerase-interacting CarD/CdnL/TRCF family regulator